MRTLLLLTFAVLGCWAKVDLWSPPKEVIPSNDDTIRWCVPSECEMKKCLRMANEWMYNVSPRKDIVCMEGTCIEHCLDWVENGYSDVIVTRENDVWRAHTVHNLKPVAYEMSEYKGPKKFENWESISIAVVPKSSPINQWSDLENKKSCHAGVDYTSSWTAPMCSMIHKNVIPHQGNMVESAAQYFKKSCVPGVLDWNYDINGTNPETLCEICGGRKEDNSWCHKNRDVYSGYYGASMCLKEGKGHVVFIDNNYISAFKNIFGTDYKLVCNHGTTDLDDWHNEDCHLGYTPRPTIFTHMDKTYNYIRDFNDMLFSAVQTYSNMNNMDIFSSDEYICSDNSDPKDIIFRDNTREFVTIPEEKNYMHKYISVMNTCQSMEPKPRAKFCVITDEAYNKCTEMKRYFTSTMKVNEVSWGCMKLPTKMDCMKAIWEGKADVVSLDPMETFIAGNDFQMTPFMSEYFDVFHEPIDGKWSYNWDTETYTIGIMKKNVYQNKFGYDNEWINLKGLNTCHAGISRVSSVHHPIGWLHSNGTIPHYGSVFESINKFFDRTCLPGSKDWNMKKDIILGHQYNWGYHGVSFYNFTGMEWFVWNVPHTWNYFNWNHQTPSYINTWKNINTWVENPESILKTKKEWKKTSTEEGWQWDTEDEIKKVDISNIWNKFFKNMKSQKKEGIKDMPKFDWTIWNLFKDNIRTVPEYMLEKIPEIEKFLIELEKITHNGFSDNIEFKWMNHPIVMNYLKVYYPMLVKRWINYADQMEWVPMTKDTYNRYTNPIWLSPEWNEYQKTMKMHQEELCTSCGGYNEWNCKEGTEEPYWGTLGSLRCIHEHKGDIAFIESHKFEPYVKDIDMIPQDFVLVCPTGKVINYVNHESIRECNYGRVPFPTLVTSYAKTGSWRWNVTKALLLAQKIYDSSSHNEYRFEMFGEHSVFENIHTKHLYPINLINQTYQTWLGPMFLRSMESLIKPISHKWWENIDEICHGETLTNVIHHHDGRCNAIVKDITCRGNPEPKTIWLGRHGYKYNVKIPMCSRPTRFIRKMVEFTCDTGYGYLHPVMIPTACECIPCEEITHAPAWSHDYHWTTEERKYTPNEWEYDHFDLWGNEPWWMNKEHHDTWFHDEVIYPLNQDWNYNHHINKRPKTNHYSNCEKNWWGFIWHPQWFQESTWPMCNEGDYWYETINVNTNWEHKEWNPRWNKNTELNKPEWRWSL
ncbi:major yolk protein precursor [Saccoglossus kowalevskii]|uniref:Major yolk protein n=1 Tax=Saccoglossus kowalevskii TaxID=10224 RepID=D1LX61_SACKO|nr:major yolk protein precursor [Saccoglossus kowalevskii]ACY92567.1 major yolk protein [Saccoglossus kowalevskii]